MDLIKLSPSKLNVFNECKRCFWTTERKIGARPRGAFPTLPGGMDRVLKNYGDNFRGGLPPELVGKLPANYVLFSDPDAKLEGWRNRYVGMSYEDKKAGFSLKGAIDDLLERTDSGAVAPFDYKTKGQLPKDDGSQYYRTQLDSYELFFQTLGMKTLGEAFLAYAYPSDIEVGQRILAKGVLVPFEVVVYKLETDPARAVRIATEAADCLRSDTMPEAAANCEYCKFVGTRDKKLAVAGSVS